MPHTFLHYMQAQEATRRRMAEYEAAGAKLELARIKERAAEIKSQHAPLAGVLEILGVNDVLNAKRDETRKLITDVAAYVVYGKKIEGVKK